MAVVRCGQGGDACPAVAYVEPGDEDLFALRSRIEAEGWAARGGYWRCPAHSGVTPTRERANASRSLSGTWRGLTPLMSASFFVCGICGERPAIGLSWHCSYCLDHHIPISRPNCDQCGASRSPRLPSTIDYAVTLTLSGREALSALQAVAR